MLLFDGIYKLERKDDPGANPAHACAWHVKIVDLSLSDPNHPHIRPFALLAKAQEGGFFKTSCAESLGKRILSDFNLQVKDLLWVETFAHLPDDMYVAVFTPRYHDALTNHTVSWRPILENERVAITPWLEGGHESSLS